MSTRGVVDVVFCIDASASMGPCLDAVRRHVVAFVDGLGAEAQRRMDWRIDFLAFRCNESGTVFDFRSIRMGTIALCGALYRRPEPQAFFTNSISEFRESLAQVHAEGDEATLVALDTALDFPWRPRRSCHRVIVLLTDEPLETNAQPQAQLSRLDELMSKAAALGVMLFIVGPESAGLARLSELDKCEYEVLSDAGDGLRAAAFDNVLAHIGKSVSVASLQAAQESVVPRAVFGQSEWIETDSKLSGR